MRYRLLSALVGALVLSLAVTGCGDCNLAAAPASTEEEVLTECGSVDIVFMMDTSGSMSDEAIALCSQLDQVLGDLSALGLTDFRVFKWGITEDGDDDSDFSCLTDNVRDLFGDPIVPGTVDRQLNLGDSDEDWGPGTAIVSELGSNGSTTAFQWRPNAIRILIPISDEGPDDGDPPDTPADAASITNAIQFAVANNVIVSPIIGTGAEPGTSAHARDLANGTNGIALRSTDPTLDIGQLIFDIVFVACGGTLEDPPPPLSPGPTILIAAERMGDIYALDPETGLESFLTRGDGDFYAVSSMIYNEETGKVWAGTGGQGLCSGCIVSVEPSGQSTTLADNYDVTDAHPGLAQRRSDRVIFGMEGNYDNLLAINNVTGAAAQFAWDVGDIAEEGNALTFVGDTLYLVSGTELWTLDTFTGGATLVAPLSLIGASGIEVYHITSMTTRPSDNKVFAILRDSTTEGRVTYLCSIDVSNGNVTIIGPNEMLLDGLTWVPSGYFLPNG